MTSQVSAAEHDSPCRTDVLVDEEWLERHREDRDVRLVEVDVSPAAYAEGHIPGAVLWNVYRDLKDADYRLIERDSFEALLRRSGIDANSTVVFYGYAPAMGFWLMKLYGHLDVRILDCSREVWQLDGRPWTAEVTEPSVTRYGVPPEDERIRATQAAVERAIGDPRSMIVDVRSSAEFSGERFWPSGGLEPGGRAGHIPSALNLSIDQVRDDRGSFASTSELEETFAPLAAFADRKLICYCTVGGRACTTWFVLTYLLGRRDVRVYDGSWAEWGRLPTAPVVAA